MGRIKKLLIIFTFPLLFLVGCNDEEEERTFKFTGEIQKIIVIGKGRNRELGSHTINNDAEMNVIEDAMQNASLLTKIHTDEGPLFDLEVIYEDGSNEIISLWYYPSSKEGRFSTDAMYSLNDQAAPALIELFESYK